MEKKGREKIGAERKGKRRMKAGGWAGGQDGRDKNEL